MVISQHTERSSTATLWLIGTCTGFVEYRQYRRWRKTVEEDGNHLAVSIAVRLAGKVAGGAGGCGVRVVLDFGKPKSSTKKHKLLSPDAHLPARDRGPRAVPAYGGWAW